MEYDLSALIIENHDYKAVASLVKLSTKTARCVMKYKVLNQNSRTSGGLEGVSRWIKSKNEIKYGCSQQSD